MKLYVSRYQGKAENTQYETEANITTFAELAQAVTRDHIAPQMRNWHRGKDDFLQADCIMLDMDNTHSDDPADWKTIDDISDTFPDVKFYYVESRNHMKEKRKKAKDGTVTIYEPRPKYHVYFPLGKEYTTHSEYEAIMLKAAGLFPYFDLGAAKPAQFFFGVPTPAGGAEDGEIMLDDYVNGQPKEAVLAAVNDFWEKVKTGQYKNGSGSETEKALTRLYNYLGVTRPAEEQPDSQTAPRGDGSGAEQYSPLGEMIAEAEQKQSLEWFEKFAQEHDIVLGKRYRIDSREHPQAIVICVSCPWEDEHSMTGADNEAVIIIELGGKLNFLCRHSHGARYGWKAYRAYYEERDRAAQQPAEPASEAGALTSAPLPGLLTYTDAVNIFETADDRHLELKSFPAFSETAKIKLHDSVVIAADTGAGKSSLAINFLNDLNNDYPCIYINLEMDKVTVLRRLTAIYSGMELDRIEGYKHDENTAAAVNITLKAITGRKPLQVIQGAYMLQQIEDIVKQSINGRTEPTIVIIDHSLLVDTQERTGSRYDRFTQVSEGLRKMALSNNIILFVLLQQNRAGKATDDERPKNSSLKESGSWENDATQICFLWYDPADRRKKLLLTKNRGGSGGEFPLNYWKKTQTYTEATAGTIDAGNLTLEPAAKQTKRERQKQKLLNAYETAYLNTFGKPTLQAIAEAADVTTSTIKTWIKEYGGFMVDGKTIDPAGIDAVVEQQDFIKLTPADNSPFDEPEPEQNEAPAEVQKKGRNR